MLSVDVPVNLLWSCCNGNGLWFQPLGTVKSTTLQFVLRDRPYHYRELCGEIYSAETDDQQIDTSGGFLKDAASLSKKKKSNGRLASKSHPLLERETVIEEHDDWRNESNFPARIQSCHLLLVESLMECDHSGKCKLLFSGLCVTLRPVVFCDQTV